MVVAHYNCDAHQAPILFPSVRSSEVEKTPVRSMCVVRSAMLLGQGRKRDVEMSGRRIASFLVVIDGVDSEPIRSALGLSPGTIRTWTRHAPGQVAWVLEYRGSPSDDVSEMIERLLSEVRTVRNRLTPLLERQHCTCILRVVIYTAPDDPVGPGFAIEPEDVHFLAELNGTLDIDLY